MGGNSPPDELYETEHRLPAESANIENGDREMDRLIILVAALMSAVMGAKAEKAAPSFASRHGNTAQIISAAVAVVAAIFVIYQVYSINKTSRVTTARQVYMSYSEASLRYPEFVEPDLAKIKDDSREYVRYKSFVGHMLFAYDEIFSVYDEPEWHRSFEADIKFHLPYICADMRPSDDEAYFKKMRDILRAERAKCPAK
jgi:hypothetical protein